MDPSLTVSNDPQHPPPVTSYPHITASNPLFHGPNHPYYHPSSVSPINNNHLFPSLPSLPSPPPPHPSFNHPPYADMICTAIAALNEPEGSSKVAISKYIERIYTGIPPAHNALLSHHLKSLKNNGVLMMVRKSYKFATTTTTTPSSLAVVATGVEPLRSEFVVNENQRLPDPVPVASSTPQSGVATQKRGRGRPPKPKPDLVVAQTNGKPSWEQNEFTVSRPMEVIQPPQPPQAQPPQVQLPQVQPLQVQIQPEIPVKRPPGRPRKDGALPRVKATVSGGVETVKRRGRPPSGRAVGRERKPPVVSAPVSVSVIPYVANGGVRRRGRPKRVDAGVSTLAAPTLLPQPIVESGGPGGEEVAVVKRRGRGRPPKIGGVIRKHMKPKRNFARTGRPLGRPRKNPVSMGASGQQGGSYVQLKKKFELFQARAKDIVVALKDEIGGTDNQALVRAIQSLEELTVETIEEPQHMEEVHADDEHTETEPEAEGHGGQQGQAQTEAEAMQEALF
ncbi:hypothetical protein AALP_AA4G074700 [Arabis alpina]|uniref:H15 domain-containing protein n=1 Tax=Arabis alpina TaxID=50452 RepID=A0A087H1S7_ARAAL|nr:hypothetical protein AALP_AA4G074700 [Arabis alpina]